MTFKTIKKIRYDFMLGIFIFLEVALLIFLFSFLPLSSVIADVIGNPNATVGTRLTVGNVYPEILNVTIDENAASVTLTANSTKTVRCSGLLRDYNNESDFDLVTAEFFHNSDSSYGGSDDDNYHYTNNSCNITYNFTSWMGVNDDEYHIIANCSFEVQYFSNAGEWNCTMFVNDSMNWNDTNSDNVTVSDLLAILLPSTINYGTVNATAVSSEQIANVTNVGNVNLNLSLEGYAANINDGQAMNCSKGSIKNISIDYEKYNLNTSTLGILTLTEFENNYTNLTTAPVIKDFGLAYRTNDTDYTAGAYNQTYWRMYVPIGVAGNCSGHIIFGATQAAGS